MFFLPRLFFLFITENNEHLSSVHMQRLWRYTSVLVSLNVLVINSLSLADSLFISTCLFNSWGCTVTAPWRFQGSEDTGSYLQYVDEAVAVHGFGTGERQHGDSLIATGAEVMKPFLSSNGTSQMERKPIGHIRIFSCTTWGLQA